MVMRGAAGAAAAAVGSASPFARCCRKEARGFTAEEVGAPALATGRRRGCGEPAVVVVVVAEAFLDLSGSPCEASGEDAEALVTVGCCSRRYDEATVEKELVLLAVGMV